MDIRIDKQLLEYIQNVELRRKSRKNTHSNFIQVLIHSIEIRAFRKITML